MSPVFDLLKVKGTTLVEIRIKVIVIQWLIVIKYDR